MCKVTINNASEWRASEDFTFSPSLWVCSSVRTSRSIAYKNDGGEETTRLIAFFVSARNQRRTIDEKISVDALWDTHAKRQAQQVLRRKPKACNREIQELHRANEYKALKSWDKGFNKQKQFMCTWVDRYSWLPLQNNSEVKWLRLTSASIEKRWTHPLSFRSNFERVSWSKY